MSSIRDTWSRFINLLLFRIKLRYRPLVIRLCFYTPRNFRSLSNIFLNHRMALRWNVPILVCLLLLAKEPKHSPKYNHSAENQRCNYYTCFGAYREPFFWSFGKWCLSGGFRDAGSSYYRCNVGFRCGRGAWTWKGWVYQIVSSAATESETCIFAPNTPNSDLPLAMFAWTNFCQG